MADIVHVLMPGDVVCADRGVRLETLLGSCVSIVLTDRHRTVGAMCHIVHCRPVDECSGATDQSASGAIETLYGLLRQRGFNPSLCDAFVYGGGNMFPGLIGGTHVGERNAEHVMARLEADGVRVIVCDLGGRAYRRVAWTIGPELPEVSAVPM